MVNDLLKWLMTKAWNIKGMITLRKKLKLYGSYDEKYIWSDYKQLSDHKKLFKPFNIKINTEWYKYFTLVRQEENPAYIPEDIWHIYMEPALNQRSYSKAFNDKNLFHRTSYSKLFPKAYLHIIQGVCYDINFQNVTHANAIDQIPDNRPIIIKKTIDTGGGKGVTFYESKKDIQELGSLINRHGKNIVIQEQVYQHNWFERLNPTSINTIRVITYRSVIDEKVHVLQTLLRIGKNGSRVDNQSSGGIACGIDSKGNLNEWGSDKLSNKYWSVNGYRFGELDSIPSFEEMKSICVEIASEKLHERVLVFDTWRDRNQNIRLLEINNINIGIEDLQKNNGALFGKFTDEVIQYCVNQPRSYCFDFEL